MGGALSKPAGGGRDRRIWEHPILKFRRGRKVRFYFNGTVVEGYEGESIAAALYAAGHDILSYSPYAGRPRGAFCMIGKCSSCFAVVDGIPNTRTCVEPVREGVRVERQEGLAEIPAAGGGVGVREEEIIDDVDVLIVGGGPAGLAAAIAAGRLGLNVLLVNEHFKLGGQLVKQTHKFFGSKDLFGGLRGFQVAEILERKLALLSNVKILLQTTAYGFFRGGWVGLAGRDRLYRVRPRYVVAAPGAAERHLALPGNDLPGVMGAGGAQTLMNEYGILPGEDILVVGSGNVGVIVSYQLLQAGARVRGVVEILPYIGAWFVHAAKIRRYGVKVLTRHTVKEVVGRNRVEGAVVVRVDERFKHVPGSEFMVPCDLLLIAVGLTPDTRLVAQAGAVVKWVPALGGLVPIRTRYLETSVPGLYIAGDASGIEEATTAMIEGEIAGLSAAIAAGAGGEEAVERRESLLKFLWDEYRASPVVARAREGKLSVTVSEEEMERVRRESPPPVSFGKG